MSISGSSYSFALSFSLLSLMVAFGALAQNQSTLPRKWNVANNGVDSCRDLFHIERMACDGEYGALENKGGSYA